MNDRPTPPPDRRWTAEELLALIEPIRRRVEEVLERHEVEGVRAEEILSHAWVAVTRSTGSDEQLRALYLRAVENACRELRAGLGPIEEQEDEPYVH